MDHTSQHGRKNEKTKICSPLLTMGLRQQDTHKKRQTPTRTRKRIRKREVVK